jgi:hypothetical protein
VKPAIASNTADDHQQKASIVLAASDPVWSKEQEEIYRKYRNLLEEKKRCEEERLSLAGEKYKQIKLGGSKVEERREIHELEAKIQKLDIGILELGKLATSLSKQIPEMLSVYQFHVKKTDKVQPLLNQDLNKELAQKLRSSALAIESSAKSKPESGSLIFRYGRGAEEGGNKYDDHKKPNNPRKPPTPGSPKHAGG